MKNFLNLNTLFGKKYDERIEVLQPLKKMYLTPAEMMLDFVCSIALAEKKSIELDSSDVKLMKMFRHRPDERRPWSLATVFGIEVGEYTYFVEVFGKEVKRCLTASFRWVEVEYLSFKKEDINNFWYNGIQFRYEKANGRLIPLFYGKFSENGDVVKDVYERYTPESSPVAVINRVMSK